MADIFSCMSPRLLMTASLIQNCDTVCDIGTDHGYLPVYLIKQRIAKRVIATDIRQGPLCTARKNIAAFGESGSIEVRLSDGFCEIEKGEAQCAVIAGMGGETIASILQKKDISASRYVLQPQSSHKELREFLQLNGYKIVNEKVCSESKKMYVAMEVVRGKMPKLSTVELEIGPALIKNKGGEFSQYVKFRLFEINSILEKLVGITGAEQRKKELEYLKSQYEDLIK